MAQIAVGIAGATGYTGAELLRLLSDHPNAHAAVVTSTKSAGKRVADELPQFAGSPSLTFAKTAPEAFESCEAVISCLPHGASAGLVAEVHARYPEIKIVDLSADFRLDEAGYRKWYGHAHAAPELLASAAYGLPELNRAAIERAWLVANPGCYPTGALLALAPLARTGLIQAPFIADSKSGVSGAGKEPSRATHFSQANEALRPYNVGTHRHAPEIDRWLSSFSGTRASVAFTPHLVPMDRGILTTAYAAPAPGVTLEDVHQALDKSYAGEPFVARVEDVDVKNVRGSNMVHLNAWLSNGLVVVATAIDNLVKGASGQAVQNLNLLVRAPEHAGLPRVGMFP